MRLEFESEGLFLGGLGCFSGAQLLMPSFQGTLEAAPTPETLNPHTYLWLVGNGGMGTIISTITTILPFPPNQR